jgi:8-oxo-dGTP pyrophosphatase MutT (NUDIX family)
MTAEPEVRPASTVVLLRNSTGGLQTLMLRRNKALIFAGGAWVFPGGSLEAEDLAAANNNIEMASRFAAAREAQEESGLTARVDEMVLLSHWTTPVGEPRRFSTWIYAAPVADDVDVVIDGSEIHDSKWLDVSEAIAAHKEGDLNMLPPTYFTLLRLADYGTVEHMTAVERDSPVPEVFPVFSVDGDDLMVMFRGDAGYDARDGSIAGPRHRAVLIGGYWRYHYTDVDPAYPPLVPQ